MAKALENAIINGTGSTQPTGLLASGVITNTGTFTKAGMTYTDLLAIIADLPDHGYRAGASLIMPSGLFYSDVLPALTDKGSGLDVQAAEKMKVLGYDVVLCDRVAAGTVIFGNLSNYAMNMADGVKIESDKSVGSEAFDCFHERWLLLSGKVTKTPLHLTFTPERCHKWSLRGRSNPPLLVH
jgi:HK97 family phage major capsid protein